MTKKNEALELPKIKPYEHGTYTPELLQKLYEVAAGKQIYIPIMIASLSAARRSEAVGMRWPLVDFDNRVIHVKNSKVRVAKKYQGFLLEHHGELTNEGNLLKLPKDDDFRTIPMSDELYEILWQWKIDQETLREQAGEDAVYNDFVCTMSNGREMRPDYVTRSFRKLLEQNNLPIIRYHDLRGTLTTLLSESGTPLRILAQLLGHASESTTERFYITNTHTYIRELGTQIDNVTKPV